jgi:hypothetical protein
MSHKRYLGSPDAPLVSFSESKQLKRFHDAEQIAIMIDAINMNRPVRPLELLHFLHTYQQLVTSADNYRRVQNALSNVESHPGGWRLLKSADLFSLSGHDQRRHLLRRYPQSSDHLS